MPILGRNHGSYYSGERPKGAVPTLQCADLPNITVTGKLVGGTVWGSNPYTVDSDWAVAAVHAGICAPGETVEISRLTPKDSSPYNGSTKNGVVTSTKTTSICGYTIRLAGTANPCGPYNEVNITGKSSGGVVYGSNPYADGTDDAMAAVHAGLCAVGETITVEKYTPGLHAPYNETIKNGISSKTILSTNRCGYYIRKKVVTPPPSDNKKIFDYVSDAPQTFTVPSGVTKIKAKLWGAGGGGGKLVGNGGGGGYTYVEIPVTPGEQLTLYVPAGGYPGNIYRFNMFDTPYPMSYTSATAFNQVTYAAGGGESGWPNSRRTWGNYVQNFGPGGPTPNSLAYEWAGFNGGAGGGGYAAIFRGSSPLAIAGGGGGAGDAANGGGGGGTSGVNGQASTLGPGGGGVGGGPSSPGPAGAGLYAALGLPGEPADDVFRYSPAKQGAGGGNGYPDPISKQAPLVLLGGGAGGHGWFGGGAGGTSCSGGGGGSGLIASGLVGNMIAGSSPAPGNASDPDNGGKGYGGPAAKKTQGSLFYGTIGREGRIVIEWTK